MITAYLLGELSDAEQEEIEVRYFTDDALFEQLLAIEDDLIDRYVRGQITDSERLRLERHFMKSPARRKRVRFAEALLRHVGVLAADVHRQRLSWWRELMTLMRPKGLD
jgi:anti-sigma factor RsiW